MSLDTRVENTSFIMLLLNIIYGFIYLVIKYVLFILPSLYYIFITLEIKYNSSPYYIITNLRDVIYSSNLLVFIQIFFGKFGLNIPFYFLNLMALKHIMRYLYNNTDIVFVDVFGEVFEGYHRLTFTLFPIKYMIMYIAYCFKCLSKKTTINFSIIVNIISLILGMLPFYLIYLLYDENTKKNIFFCIPLLVYSIANLYISGKKLNDILTYTFK